MPLHSLIGVRRARIETHSVALWPREVHAGLSSPDTGASNADLKNETNALVEKLLAQH
jgi:hypothetical protein